MLCVCPRRPEGAHQRRLAVRGGLVRDATMTHSGIWFCGLRRGWVLVVGGEHCPSPSSREGWKIRLPLSRYPVRRGGFSMPSLLWLCGKCGKRGAFSGGLGDGGFGVFRIFHRWMLAVEGRVFACTVGSGFWRARIFGRKKACLVAR
jgi:hypothetical protein